MDDIWDVIVVGGGAAGLGAAYGATKAGARTLILESGPCLGGAMTTRNVASYCGLYTCSQEPRPVIKGVWSSIQKHLLEINATREHPHKHRGVFQVVDPELTKCALDEFVMSEGINVLYHVQVVSATRSPSPPASSASTCSSPSSSKSDNDYMNDSQNDNHNQNSSKNFVGGGVGLPSGGGGMITSVTIHERHGQRTLYARAFVDASGDGDLAAYAGASTRYGNKGKANLGSLATRFTGFEPNANPNAVLWSEAIKSAKLQNPELASTLHKSNSVLLNLPGGDIITFLASASYDARSAKSITQAEIDGRRQAQGYLKILKALPGHQNMRLVASGPDFGTRESRRINCLYQIKEQDVMQGAKFEDTIALGSWGCEFHDENDPIWASSFVLPGGPDGVYDIPLRALCSTDTPNLFAAGRTVDGDRMGGASVRVMGTALATGQAAGVAASLVALKSAPSPPPYGQVRDILLAQGAILDRKNIGLPVQIHT